MFFIYTWLSKGFGYLLIFNRSFPISYNIKKLESISMNLNLTKILIKFIQFLINYWLKKLS